jgi:PAS domain S-box-containing protein
MEGRGVQSLGIAPEIVLGQSVFAIPTIPRIHAHVRRALAREACTAIEHIGEHTFKACYAPHYDLDGGIVGVVGVALDITERNHLPALGEHEANYRLLIEHIPAITYIAALDDSSSTLYTSPQIETILGFTQAEWMADRTLWLQQVHPDDRAMVLAALRRSQAGEIAPCEYCMLTRDGAVVWFRDESALLRDANGYPLYLYGVMLNITERKQLEAELDVARRRLAQSREAERVRLACDFHDGPVQQLLGLGYLLDDSNPSNSGAFTATPAQTPAFSQAFPTINLNPPTGTVPGAPVAIGVNSRPMVNVTTGLNGNYTGSILIRTPAAESRCVYCGLVN